MEETSPPNSHEPHSIEEEPQILGLSPAQLRDLANLAAAAGLPAHIYWALKEHSNTLESPEANTDSVLQNRSVEALAKEALKQIKRGSRRGPQLDV